jgi:predicted ATP-grasp superfamily ATP-dependent carboligase
MKRHKAAAMRIRTQKLPNSFSLDNKKQKAVLPESAPRTSVLAKATLSEAIEQLAVAVKSRTLHTVGRDSGQVARYGRVHLRNP